MKKYIAALIICLFPFLSFADVDEIEGTATSAVDTIEGSTGHDTVEGQAVASGAAAFCAGGELFCEDFEGADVAWDSTATQEDCNLDGDGDWCDDATGGGEYAANAAGVEAVGLVGNITEAILIEALGTVDQSEFYVECWIAFEDTTGQAIIVVSGDAPYDTLRFGSSTNIFIETKNGTTDLDTGDATAADTWYHVGVYYKQETADVANDGTVRAWWNQDGTTFEAGDLISGAWEGNVDTGTTPADQIELRGNSTTGSAISRVDDCKVVAGDPGWPIS